MSITKDTALRFLAALFPPVCLGCNRIEGVTSLPLGLCNSCHSRLRQPERGISLYQTNRQILPALETLSCWSYEPPFDAVIHGLKFGRLEYLGRDLAAGLHPLVEDTGRSFDVVVPIPLHWHRRLRRGYNQAEAIARPLARLLGVPLLKPLRRQRSTRPQARLARGERAANLRLAFAMRRSQDSRLRARQVLLVDDVVTTGATIQAAAGTLLESGAFSVLGLTAARTPISRSGVVTLDFDRKDVNSV